MQSGVMQGGTENLVLYTAQGQHAVNCDLPQISLISAAWNLVSQSKEDYLTTSVPSHITFGCFMCCVLQKVCKCTLPVMPQIHAKLLCGHTIYFRERVLGILPCFMQTILGQFDEVLRVFQIKINWYRFMSTEMKQNQTDGKLTFYL